MRWCAFLMVSVLLLFGGCGTGPKSTKAELARISLLQRKGLWPEPNELVLSVGGETITSDEVIKAPVEHNGMIVSLIERLRPLAQTNDFEQFERQVSEQVEQVVAEKVLGLLLFQQAKSDMGGNINEALERAAETEFRKFAVSHGNDDAKIEEALKRAGMDRQSFREHQKRLILSEYYIHEKLLERRPITHSELIDCYNGMKEELFAVPAMLKFWLMDIEVAKLEVTDPNESRWQLGKDVADELLGRLQDGGDWGELAKKKSERYGQGSVVWRIVKAGSNLAEPYDTLAVEAEKIESGQVAGPIKAGEHIFIMKLEEKRPKSFEPFEKVQKQVEAKIIFERRKKALDEVRIKLERQAAVGEKQRFVDFCVEKIYQMCNQRHIVVSEVNNS